MNNNYNNNLETIVTAMELYGGSFVKALAELYWKADELNKRRLLQAFPDYFQKYDEMATLRTRRG